MDSPWISTIAGTAAIEMPRPHKNDFGLASGYGFGEQSVKQPSPFRHTRDDSTSPIDGLYQAFDGLSISYPSQPVAVDNDYTDYLDQLRMAQGAVVAELNEAQEVYWEVTELRDTNLDVGREANLNRQFLEANNRLARARREYRAYKEDVEELRALPQFCRSVKHKSHPVAKSDHAAIEEPAQPSPKQQNLRPTQDQIAGLENERRELIEKTNAIDAMAEHIAYIETMNQDLQRKIASTQETCTQLHELLEDSYSTVRDYQAQLAHAESIITQNEGEIRDLKDQETMLNAMFARAEETGFEVDMANEDLRTRNEELGVQNAELRRENEYVRHEFTVFYGEVSGLLGEDMNLHRLSSHAIEQQKSTAEDIAGGRTTVATTTGDQHGDEESLEDELAVEKPPRVDNVQLGRFI